MAGAATGLLSLVIVTPAGSVTKSEVTEVQAPGVMGEFGVLPGHIPFLSVIGAGVLTYVEGGKPRVLAVGPGYVEVGTGESVVVLTESSATPEEIDLAAVSHEEQEATAALAQLSPVEQAAEHTHKSSVQAWARARREAVERVKASAAH
jgi:F-type H+-transporting ATPase subunit epsilon